MPNLRKYRLNPETLLYDVEAIPVRARVLRIAVFLLLSIAMTFAYMMVYTRVLGLELPKTLILKRRNAALASRAELLSRQLDAAGEDLDGLALRDEEIYRSIFGMAGISPEVRNAGLPGPDASMYQGVPGLWHIAERTGRLMKKASVQAVSFDDVSQLSRRAGDMVSCIPAVPPINPRPSTYRLSSPFGYRSDPITGGQRLHAGFDFACNPGNPVYAVGDGVVESASFELFGYGNSVVIDHGFGYKTRYAHLKSVFVSEKMQLKRGECIGLTGNSGRTTGPHLHYEVLYKGNRVNPSNFFDLSMDPKEYEAMVEKAARESEGKIIRPHTRVRR